MLEKDILLLLLLLFEDVSFVKLLMLLLSFKEEF
jgi:hypothetical protein